MKIKCFDHRYLIDWTKGKEAIGIYDSSGHWYGNIEIESGALCFIGSDLFSLAVCLKKDDDGYIDITEHISSNSKFNLETMMGDLTFRLY